MRKESWKNRAHKRSARPTMPATLWRWRGRRGRGRKSKRLKDVTHKAEKTTTKNYQFRNSIIICLFSYITAFCITSHISHFVLHGASSFAWRLIKKGRKKNSHYQHGLLVFVFYTVCGYSMVGIPGLPALIHTAGLSQQCACLPPPRSHPVLDLHD